MITISARPGISCWQSTLSKRKDRTRSCCGELRTSQRNLEDPFPSGAGSLGSPPFSTRGTGDHGRPGAGRVGALWLGVWAAGPHSLLEGPRGRSRLCQGVLKAGLGSAGNGGGVPEVGPLLCGGWGVQVAGPGLCWWGGVVLEAGPRLCWGSTQQVPGSAESPSSSGRPQEGLGSLGGLFIWCPALPRVCGFVNCWVSGISLWREVGP